MREILFFVITMITVMMASTMGTVRLVRSAHQGHLKRSWAKTGLWILGLTLPIAVPAAMGAIFLQVLQLLAKSKGFPIHGDRKSTRLNSSHLKLSRMPSSA